MSHKSISAMTGVVLAGGQARRMGGQDKGLIELCGEPLVAHSVRHLAPQVNRIIINANRNIEQYQRYAEHIIGDDLDGFQGPLAGMLAAMQAATTDYILTVPCDSPLLSADYADRMMQAMQSAELAVASDGERLQPVFALLPCRLQQDLRAFLESGERKIDRWFARHNMATCDFSDSVAMFRNINTPEELTALAAELESS